MDIIKPVLNEPALLINESENRRFLVIADLHLGIEFTLIEKGLQVPSQTQTQRLIKKLQNIIERVKPTELIILGDVKHSVPMISHQEWHIIPNFFEKFRDLSIHIIIGNHESTAQMEGLTTRNVNIHPANGWLMKLRNNDKITRVGLFHGHTWPRREIFNADILILAHNHPVIEFKDELNVRTFEPAWIKAHWNKKKVAEAYLKYSKLKKTKKPLEILKDKFQIHISNHPEIIIMPAFNDLLGGIPFNKKELRYIGPLLKSNSLNIDDAEVILLDGTILGKIKNIRLEE